MNLEHGQKKNCWKWQAKITYWLIIILKQVTYNIYKFEKSLSNDKYIAKIPELMNSIKNEKNSKPKERLMIRVWHVLNFWYKQAIYSMIKGILRLYL